MVVTLRKGKKPYFAEKHSFDLKKKDMFESFRNTFNIQLKYCMVYNGNGILCNGAAPYLKILGQEKFFLKLSGDNIEK